MGFSGKEKIEIYFQLKNVKLGRTSSFICMVLKHGWKFKALEYLEANKPNSNNEFKHFTTHKSWIDDYSWWKVFGGETPTDEVLDIKRQFIKELQQKVLSEMNIFNKVVVKVICFFQDLRKL